MKDLENRLQQHLATHVTIHHGEKRGRIEIEFYGSDDLQRVLGALGSTARCLKNKPWLRRGSLFLRIIGLVILSLTGCKPASSKGKPWQEFSGERALAHVQALVDLGPRPPESDAIKKARAYIHQQLEATGWQVIDQPFAAQTPRGTVQFVNLIARRPDQPQSEKLYFVGSHYDTKTFDSIRFVGANDGGSSSGALIELGRVLSQHPDLAARIELIFFDGEEAYESFTDSDGLYGSRFFAKKARQASRATILSRRNRLGHDRRS